MDRSNITQTLSTGTAIMTKDGARLGSVKEVTGRCFKVDAPFHNDYWLSMDLVETTNDTGIILELTAAGVAEHQMDGPELTSDEDPMQAITAKPVIDATEMLEQRARMEHELAEQSRALPPHELSVTQLRGPRAYERIPADHTGFGDLAGELVPNAPVLDELSAQAPASSSEAADLPKEPAVGERASAPNGSSARVFEERSPYTPASSASRAADYEPPTPTSREEWKSAPRGSAVSRIAMVAAPILLSSATIVGAALLFRRLRRRKAETLPEHTRRVVKDGAKEAGTVARGGAKGLGTMARGGAKGLGKMARARAKSTAHAAKPKIKSTAVVARERTRRLIHDGLTAAAKQFD